MEHCEQEESEIDQECNGDREEEEDDEAAQSFEWSSDRESGEEPD
jgi:hypothetical protein